MNDLASPQSTALADRARLHVEPHVRTLQEQTLDALLRIEELLTTVFADKLPLNALKPDLETIKKERAADKPKGGKKDNRYL